MPVPSSHLRRCASRGTQGGMRRGQAIALYPLTVGKVLLVLSIDEQISLSPSHKCDPWVRNRDEQGNMG